MPILNIENSFITENRSVLDFLNQSGQGLYIPLYQRDYSWDSDNIEQLIEDLTRGIQRLASGEIKDSSKEIRFLGTIITVIENNKQNIYPVDNQAIPGRIEKLIDGQQRISTIALISTILTKRLTEIRNKVTSENVIYEQINEICDIWINDKLSRLFSFDLGRGIPKLKPKIVRGQIDYWTRDKDVDDAYKSELSNYLGHFIKSYVDKTVFPCISKEKYGDTLLYRNGKRVEIWLKKTVALAHEEEYEEDFPPAIRIIKNFSQDQLWQFDRPDLVSIIEENNKDKKSNSYILSELIQTLAVCHYLLDRCCFTIIQPTDDDWAFDMFQSLNATGTPLTAIETFKPTVVNTTDKERGQFKDSTSELFFKKIEAFLSDATTAQQKNKRTNDYLTSFFVAHDGRTISNHFSYQRKVLNDVYTNLPLFEEKEFFIVKMGNYAEFYQKWNNYYGEKNDPFPLIGSTDDAYLASMLILFLKACNHKMAITVLAKIYSYVINREEGAVQDFIEITKAVGAYYFLWRSTYPNSGLDATYRDLFKSMIGKKMTVDDIKQFFASQLDKKEISTKETWINRAKDYFRYNKAGKDVTRLALLIAAHDTIPDPDNNGMIKKGRPDCAKYLSLDKWLSADLKTVEHIAPQTDNDKLWDVSLYDTHIEPFQSLGNLTLLPQDLNSSASNKGWKEKLLYYQCVAEKDPDVIKAINDKAKRLGIDFNHNTVELLQKCNYNNHLASISAMSTTDSWNTAFVDKRTNNMLDIIWDRVSTWIF